MAPAFFDARCGNGSAQAAATLRANFSTMRVCVQCAGPTDDEGSCLVCGFGTPQSEGVQVPWHVTSALSPGVIPLSPPPPRPAPRPSMAEEGLKFPKLAPNCYQCTFFSITHIPSFPRACSRFGFKGKELPSHTLFNVSGKNCPYFDPLEP